MPPSRKRNRTSASPAPSGGGGSPSDDGSSPPASVPGSSPDADEPRPDPRLGGGTPDEEEDGEELIGEDMEADYRPMGALDEYEEEGLDANDYVPISAGARFAADAALDARDVRERQSRMPAALLTSDDDDDRPRQRRRRPADADLGDGDDLDPAAGLEGFLDDGEGGINLEDYNGPLSEWIISPAVSEEIRRRFRRFLTSYDASASADGEKAAGDASSRYSQRVRNMCAANKESLDVSYLHLSQSVPILAIWVADCPKEMFKLLDEAAMEVVRIMFPDYDQIHQVRLPLPDHVLRPLPSGACLLCARSPWCSCLVSALHLLQAIHVRITNLPIQDSIRDLRQCHMGCLVKIAGVVTRRSGVYPQMKICRYNCTHCGYVMGPYTVSTEETKMQGVLCHSCQAKGPYQLNTEQTVYCNYQKLTLQVLLPLPSPIPPSMCGMRLPAGADAPPPPSPLLAHAAGVARLGAAGPAAAPQGGCAPVGPDRRGAPRRGDRGDGRLRQQLRPWPQPQDSMVKVRSWRGHSCLPEASLTAFEGLGLPSALVTRGPASQMPPRGLSLPARGRPSRRFRCV